MRTRIKIQNHGLLRHLEFSIRPDAFTDMIGSLDFYYIAASSVQRCQSCQVMSIHTIQLVVVGYNGTKTSRLTRHGIIQSL